MFELNLNNPIYSDEDKAREHLESVLWPHGAVCPRCGVMGDRVTKLAGKSTRPGVYKCKDCRKPFSVTVGTVLERSHIKLKKWLLAAQLKTASKKGISALQLSRMLDVTYETAWFMSYRLNEAAAVRSTIAPTLGEASGPETSTKPLRVLKTTLSVGISPNSLKGHAIGMIEDVLKTLNRAPGWKRIGELPPEVDDLKQRVAALEEKLGGKWPPDVCKHCGARAVRMSGSRADEASKKVRQEWACRECNHVETRLA